MYANRKPSNASDLYGFLVDPSTMLFACDSPPTIFHSDVIAVWRFVIHTDDMEMSMFVTVSTPDSAPTPCTLSTNGLSSPLFVTENAAMCEPTLAGVYVIVKFVMAPTARDEGNPSSAKFAAPGPLLPAPENVNTDAVPLVSVNVRTRALLVMTDPKSVPFSPFGASLFVIANPPIPSTNGYGAVVVAFVVPESGLVSPSFWPRTR